MIPSAECKKKAHIGGYLDVVLEEKLKALAQKETRGNKSALLEIFLSEGVQHLATPAGAEIIKHAKRCSTPNRN